MYLMKQIFYLAAALLMALGLDGASKFWTEQTFEPYQPVPLIGEFLRLTLGYNTGVAFGLFANGGPWPLVVTGIIILGLVIWFVRALVAGHFSVWAALPIGLLLGGAIGNFIDRLLDGQVTDFIDVGIGASRWPTFNLADSFIMIGVGLLMLASFHSHREEQAAAPYNNVSPESEADSFIT
jgi:signal peptidase II